MAENFDPENNDFLLTFIKQLGCRPPDVKAYQALLLANKIEREIISGDRQKLEGMSDSTFQIVKLGYLTDESHPNAEELFTRSVELVDTYVCKRCGVNLDDLDAAFDWQIDQVDLIRTRGSLN